MRRRFCSSLLHAAAIARSWSSFQLVGSASPLSVTDSAITRLRACISHELERMIWRWSARSVCDANSGRAPCTFGTIWRGFDQGAEEAKLLVPTEVCRFRPHFDRFGFRFGQQCAMRPSWAHFRETRLEGSHSIACSTTFGSPSTNIGSELARTCHLGELGRCLPNLGEVSLRGSRRTESPEESSEAPYVSAVVCA